MLENRRLYTVISHGLSLLIGWAAWACFQPHISPAEPQASSAPSQKSGNGKAPGADEILAIISPKDTKPAPSREEWMARTEKYKSDFLALLQTMPVPADFTAAAEAELAACQKHPDELPARMAALMYQWANKDLPGMLEWIGKSENNPRGSCIMSCLEVIVPKMAVDHGVDSILPIFNNSEWGTSAEFAISAYLPGAQAPQLISELKEKLSTNQWDTVKFGLSANWPWDQKSKFVEFAVQENQPELLVNLSRYHRDDPAAAATWILQLLNDESLDAGFREKIAGADKLKQIGLANYSLPMDQRITLLQGGDQKPPSQQAYNEIAGTDVANVLINGKDWAYSFRHGEATAAEVLDEISRQIPETTAKASEAVRLGVFEKLVEQDSSRAMELLDGLPENERTRAIIDAAQNRFYNVDPNIFLTALQQIPSTDPQYWDARLDAWTKHSPENLRRLDTEYVEWVQALPAGLDRDMALYSLAQASDKENPTLARNLRGQIQNAELKRRDSAKP